MKVITPRRFFMSLAVGLIALGAGGCASVEPWERGNLADFTMLPDRDPLYRAMTEHIHFSREASNGGRGVGGGGCGCN